MGFLFGEISALLMQCDPPEIHAVFPIFFFRKFLMLWSFFVRHSMCILDHLGQPLWRSTKESGGFMTPMLES